MTIPQIIADISSKLKILEGNILLDEILSDLHRIDATHKKETQEWQEKVMDTHQAHGNARKDRFTRR
jgi:hypothetical protein